MSENFSVPEIPRVSPQDMENAYKSGTTLNLAIDTLRCLGVATISTASLLEESEEFKRHMSGLRWRICVGHINKALKLSMSVLQLAQSGKYGEGINYLAYQAFNTIVQALWLNKCTDDQLNLYLNTSFRSEKAGFERVKKNGTETQKKFAFQHYKKIFEEAGLNVETFEAGEGHMPTITSMLKELNLDSRIHSTYDILGFHQIRTTYVDLISFYLEKEGDDFHPKTEHKYPKSYHLSAIALPLCQLMTEYTQTYFSDTQLKKMFADYFSDFNSWSTELHDFLLGRMFSKASTTKKLQNTRNESSIQQHKFTKKELVPPFKQMDFTNISWANDRLPNMLWAMALINGLGRSNALNIFRQIIKQILKKETHAGDLTFDAIATLSPEDKDEIFEILRSDKKAVKAITNLKVLTMIPGIADWPSIKIKDEKKAWTFLAKCIDSGLDHQSQDSTDCRWVRVAAEIAAGKLVLPTKGNYHEILEYPNYGDQRKVRPSIRANEMMIDSIRDKGTEPWVKVFWEECFKKTGCIMPVSGLPKQKLQTSLLTVDNVDKLYESLGQKYIQHLPSTHIEAKYDAVFGIALFSTHLAKEVTVNAENNVLGLFGLRAIAEALINLRYLHHKNDINLWNKFRDYGAGKAKLSSLKFEDSKIPPSFLPLEKLKIIANEDRWQEFLNINVGDWSNEDLRTRAIQSDSKEIYDKYYEWPSTFSHSQWGAIRYCVFQNCANPLHRLHRIPIIPAQFRTVIYDLEILINEILNVVASIYPDSKVTLREISNSKR